MKLLLSSRGLFSLGFIILILTNIVVLSGVASNRSGEPESEITITERELQLPYRMQKENSGLALRLTWRALGEEDKYNNYSNLRTPSWLNAEKLEDLGFTVNNYESSADNTTFYKQPIPKEVFIVLEYEGEPYKEAVKRAETALEIKKSSFKLNPSDKMLRDSFESAEERLEREHRQATRLFAIDAGLDPSELREKYRDQSRFIITKGLIKARYDYDKNKKKMFGYISRLSVENIHVPLKLRQVFDTILAQKNQKRNDFEAPRFEVKLAYGNRLEPWIASVNTLP